MPDTEIKTRIKLRTDTLANWEVTNPVLLAGEIAVVKGEEIDKVRFKVGDGSTTFNNLKWASEPTYNSTLSQLEF